MKLTKERYDQIKNEIQHIFDSGANEIRIFNMVDEIINSIPDPIPPDIDRMAETVMGKINGCHTLIWGDGFPLYSEDVIRLSLRTAIASVVGENTELDKLKAEYKQLLSDEYEEAIIYAAAHGWKSSRHKKGVELREAIKRHETND